MQIKTNPKDLKVWHAWFAWRPVSVGNTIVWLENIERRCEFGAVFGDQFNFYRLPKAAKNGEERVIKKKIWNLPFDVVALCEDSETPYVIFRQDGKDLFFLADVQADELIERIKTAISYLPSSK